MSSQDIITYIEPDRIHHVSDTDHYMLLNSTFRDRNNYPSPTSFECSTQRYKGSQFATDQAPILQVDVSVLPINFTGSSWAIDIPIIIISPSTVSTVDRLVIQLPIVTPSITGFYLVYQRDLYLIVHSSQLSSLVWDVIVGTPFEVDISVSGVGSIQSAYANGTTQTIAPWFERELREFRVNVPDNHYTNLVLTDIATGLSYTITNYESESGRITYTPSSPSTVFRYVVSNKPLNYPIDTVSSTTSTTIILTNAISEPVDSIVYVYNTTMRSMVQARVVDSTTLNTFTTHDSSAGDLVIICRVEVTSFPLIRPIVEPYVCREIECISLTLPNAPIESRLGGSISSQPYVILRVTTQQTSSADTSSKMYSNVPFAVHFVCPIRDISTFSENAFIRIDGSTERINMYIGVRDAFRVDILTSDGLPLKYIKSDNPIPFPPDPYAQCTVLLRIK